MEYPNSFDFTDLQPQDYHPYQHQQYPPQHDSPCPAEGDPEEALSDLAATLGISLEELFQQWARITVSGDNSLNCLTDDLHINVNGSLYESTYNYSDGGSSCDVGNVSVEQPIMFDHKFCISPQALFVNPPQNALSSNPVGRSGMTAQPKHVFAPVAPSGVAQHTTHAYRDAAINSIVPDHPDDTANITNTRIVPRAESQEAHIHVMYPIPEPRKLGLLQPGYYNLLSQDPVFNSQKMLDVSFAAAMRDVVLIVPRPLDFVGNPSLPPILFIDLNKRRRPGPYVRDILNGEAKLQGAKDWVLEHHNWKTTPIRLNWPGCTTSSEVISCTNRRGQPLTRTELAHIVACKIVMLFQQPLKTRKLLQTIDSNTAPWDLRRINPMKVRLIGVSYYRKLWVPILTTNAKSSIWDSAVGPFPAVAYPDRIFPPVAPPRTRPGMRYAFRP